MGRPLHRRIAYNHGINGAVPDHGSEVNKFSFTEIWSNLQGKFGLSTDYRRRRLYEISGFGDAVQKIFQKFPTLETAN
jgi:hypothetical protein